MEKMELSHHINVVINAIDEAKRQDSIQKILAAFDALREERDKWWQAFNALSAPGGKACTCSALDEAQEFVRITTDLHVEYKARLARADALAEAVGAFMEVNEKARECDCESCQEIFVPMREALAAYRADV